ncbi:MAG TPA: helix-turn-helix domain-containing protein [Chloroflexota bacterium]|nr:helix-turn-helix domain-containing protein [Chloroflexota bacterium]
MFVTHKGVTEDGGLVAPEVVLEPSGETCTTVREVLNRVGDKWSVLVIVLLGGGTKRFTELRRSIEGISQRMLTLTLRQLERDGLVQRTVHPTVPPRVEYALTGLGRTLLEPVMALGAWAEAHRQDIEAARRAFDERQAATREWAADGPQRTIERTF